MLHRLIIVAMSVFLFVAVGCGDDTGEDETTDTSVSVEDGLDEDAKDVTDDIDPESDTVDPESDTHTADVGTDSADTTTGEFDPDNPGTRMALSLGIAQMMGQPVSFLAGSFVITGREDLIPPTGESEIAFETCEETSVTYTPTCTDSQECAPEQECLPKTDRDGNPIANSSRCTTPKTPLDMGPFTVNGFTTGTKTMVYNAAKNGGYTTEGGDGTIPPSDLSYDTTYTFEGAGDGAQGLGAFSGSLRLSPQIALTQPPMTTLTLGISGVEVDETQDLDLVWSGSAPGAEMTITLTGGSMSGGGHTITCRTQDAGQFTIPASMVQAAQLDDMAMLNSITFERKNAGTVSGNGITSFEVGTVQSAVINVGKK